jgi:Bacterial regulatory helix-turn-helix protein, lysR family
VAVTEAGQFSEAAADLSLTQQAVSKRVAALEKDLGVRLLARTARGVQLTTHGEAFLPHARELLQAEERAAASVHPGRSALRVDVIGRCWPRPCCCAIFIVLIAGPGLTWLPCSTPARPSPRSGPVS